MVGNIEVINSSGDAKYGPLLYLGEESVIDPQLLPDGSDWKGRSSELSIHGGFGNPPAGKGMSPFRGG